MVCQLKMTVFAREILLATAHPNSDDIEFSVVVDATSLRVHTNAANLVACGVRVHFKRPTIHCDSFTAVLRVFTA
jgi:hypothetical protein